MLGEEITEPPVVNFHANVRFAGPTVAVDEWEGSARHMGQSLVAVSLLPIAQTWLKLSYSLPEIASTASVTLPGIRKSLPYAIATDSLGAKASMGNFHLRAPV